VSYLGRVSKWCRVPAPDGSEWQLISHRTGVIPPINSPSAWPGIFKWWGEGLGTVIDGQIINRLFFRGGWTVAVGPYRSKDGAITSRRCPDRESADALVERLVDLIAAGGWNPNMAEIPE